MSAFIIFGFSLSICGPSVGISICGIEINKNITLNLAWPKLNALINFFFFFSQMRFDSREKKAITLCNMFHLTHHLRNFYCHNSYSVANKFNNFSIFFYSLSLSLFCVIFDSSMEILQMVVCNGIEKMPNRKTRWHLHKTKNNITNKKNAFQSKTDSKIE